MVAAKQSSIELHLGEPLQSVSISYEGASRVGASDHKEAVDGAYEKGYNEASSHYNQQILDFRAEVNELREQSFANLENKFNAIVEEAREALMSLTYECVTRILGGFEMEPEAVSKIVDTMIEESGLNEESMQIRMHPEDIKLLSELDEEMKAKHPGLSFEEDTSLSRGDCILNSRFGKVDGLMATKIGRLKESFGG
ncbi:hypothetical protein MLD52_04670 [Puniceicoccaceae bacterium K14]|nr:hypothetical protein [Puniceicoccaceae bacterium K14]